MNILRSGQLGSALGAIVDLLGSQLALDCVEIPTPRLIGDGPRWSPKTHENGGLVPRTGIHIELLINLKTAQALANPLLARPRREWPDCDID
jgi:hypothetical protein